MDEMVVEQEFRYDLEGDLEGAGEGVGVGEFREMLEAQDKRAVSSPKRASST
jgi:hypothetical protein